MMGKLLARKYVGGEAGGALDPKRLGVEAPIYRIIGAQVVTTLTGVIACIYFDWVAAYSILFGGTVCIVPAMFVAWQLNKKTAKPTTAMIHVTMAEAGKLLLTVALFIAVFVMVKPLNLLFFFGSIITLHSLYIFVPMIDMHTRKVHISD